MFNNRVKSDLTHYKKCFTFIGFKYKKRSIKENIYFNVVAKLEILITTIKTMFILIIPFDLI